GGASSSIARAGDGGTRLVGLAAADVSTGELRLATVAAADVESYLARLAPREMIVARASSPSLPSSFDGALMTGLEPWEFDAAVATDQLAAHYGVLSLDGLGLNEGDALAIGAAGALLRYLRDLQPSGVPHLARPIIERPGGAMPLDEMTRRNLELVESLRGGADAIGGAGTV